VVGIYAPWGFQRYEILRGPASYAKPGSNRSTRLWSTWHASRTPGNYPIGHGPTSQCWGQEAPAVRCLPSRAWLRANKGAAFTWLGRLIG
jgi:hypothetical protein